MQKYIRIRWYVNVPYIKLRLNSLVALANSRRSILLYLSLSDSRIHAFSSPTLKPDPSLFLSFPRKQSKPYSLPFGFLLQESSVRNPNFSSSFGSAGTQKNEEMKKQLEKKDEEWNTKIIKSDRMRSGTRHRLAPKLAPLSKLVPPPPPVATAEEPAPPSIATAEEPTPPPAPFVEMNIPITPQEKKLTRFALHLAIIEKIAKGISKLAFICATVVLLGDFISDLKPKDFWFITTILVVQGAHLFTYSHELKWLHQSTRILSANTYDNTYDWEDFVVLKNISRLL